jgi:hypothetical protein
MTVAVQQTVDPRFLLQLPAGWDYAVSPKVVRQVTPDSLTHVALDGFEWNDVQLGGSVAQRVPQAVATLRAQLQARGSDLYAYALIHHTDLSVCLPIIGCVARSDKYRLIVLHSQVQLGFWALAGLAILLIGVLIVYQYLTMGQSPALGDLQRFWTGIFNAAGDAAGKPVQAATNSIIWLAGAAGVAAIAFALAAREAGVPSARAPVPKGKFGVDAGPFGGEVGI